MRIRFNRFHNFLPLCVESEISCITFAAGCNHRKNSPCVDRDCTGSSLIRNDRICRFSGLVVASLRASALIVCGNVILVVFCVRSTRSIRLSVPASELPGLLINRVRPLKTSRKRNLFTVHFAFHNIRAQNNHGQCRRTIVTDHLLFVRSIIVVGVIFDGVGYRLNCFLLEVCIVCVRFVYAITIFRRSKLSSFTHVRSSIITSPIVEHIITTRRSSGSCSSAVFSLYSFRCQGNGTHIGAIVRNRIVDGYFVFFPNGKQIIILTLILLFISSDLFGSISIDVSISIFGPDQEVCSRTALSLCPTLEHITGT